MRTASASNQYERTLRTVMWMDAFLSVALVVVCILASPILATVGLPRGIVMGVGVAAIVCAILLAGFGVVTAIVIMLRMRAGDYFLPPRLRLPLPRPMRPVQVATGER